MGLFRNFDKCIFLQRSIATVGRSRMTKKRNTVEEILKVIGIYLAVLVKVHLL
jgi:hypothetical protein